MWLKDHWETLDDSKKLRYFLVMFFAGAFFIISSSLLVAALLRVREFEKNPVVVMGFVESKDPLMLTDEHHPRSFEYTVSYKIEGKVDRTKINSSFSFLRHGDSIKLYYILARKEIGFISDVVGSYTYFTELVLTIVSSFLLILFIVVPGIITSFDRPENSIFD